jgi:hypothetical protein
MVLKHLKHKRRSYQQLVAINLDLMVHLQESHGIPAVVEVQEVMDPILQRMEDQVDPIQFWEHLIFGQVAAEDPVTQPLEEEAELVAAVEVDLEM